MKKIAILFIVLLPSFLPISCEKYIRGKDHLPPPTQSGAQTFGCKIDGEVWVPNGTHDLFVSVPALSARIGRDPQIGQYLYVSARRDPSLFSNESYDDISFVIIDFFQTSSVVISSTCPGGCGIYCPFSEFDFRTAGVSCFITDSTHTGKLVFSKRDTLNRIASGIFEFTAYDRIRNRIIRVTDGRFDVQLR